jgi:hypothetical protein
MDKHIAQELRIRSVATGEVFDWSGGNKGEGILYGGHAHGNKVHQMVSMRLHA